MSVHVLPLRRRAAIGAVSASLLSLIAVLFLAFVPAHAAESDNLVWGVNPASAQGPDKRSAFDYKVAPGTTIRDWVAVTNSSTQPLDFHVYAADAMTDYDTADFTLISPEKASKDVGSWVSLNNKPSDCTKADKSQLAQCLAGIGVTLTLQPGTSANIPFTLTVPANAAPGDHAAGIVAVHDTTSTNAKGATVRQENRAGTRIYLRVDGALKPQLGVSGAVSGWKMPTNPVGSGAAWTGFDLVNSGNVRLSADVSISLSGPFGIGRREFYVDPVENILPGQKAHVQSQLKDVPPLLLLFSDIKVTPRTASGVSTVGDTPPAPIAESSIAWALPWTAVLILVVVIAGGAGAYWWRRRAQRRHEEEMAALAEQLRAEAGRS